MSVGSWPIVTARGTGVLALMIDRERPSRSDQATEFEQLGGRLLDLSAKEWQQVAEAE